MKHRLMVIRPPYATQIIVQTDGSIMLKYEIERKQDMIDMLAQAVLELTETGGSAAPAPLGVPPAPQNTKPLPPPSAQAQAAQAKVVVPDTGAEPPMRMVVAGGVATEATCMECGAKGTPSNLQHLEFCPDSKKNFRVMPKCVCGCSEGIHWHTNRLASCARCGPVKCQIYTPEQRTLTIIKHREGPTPEITFDAVSPPTNEKETGDLVSKDQERLA